MQRAEYGDKSPSSSLVNIYSIVATFSQTSAGVIQTLYAYSAPVHSHIRICTGMVGWWASKNKPQSPFKAQWCSMFNVQCFQQGDLALLRIETSSLQKILKVHEIYKTRAYNIVISMNQCLLNPFPLSPTMYHIINLHCSWLMAATKIKCMHTINVNAICEYQRPVISTIVAVDTLY